MEPVKHKYGALWCVGIALIICLIIACTVQSRHAQADMQPEGASNAISLLNPDNTISSTNNSSSDSDIRTKITEYFTSVLTSPPEVITSPVTTQSPETQMTSVLPDTDKALQHREVEPTTEVVTTTPHEHFFVQQSTANPTCVQEGEICWRCQCGEEYYEKIPASGHHFEQVDKVPAKCTAAGYIEERCVCGEIRRTTIEALGHSWEKSFVTNATEEAEGYELWKCKMCGEAEKRNVTPKLPHTHKYTLANTKAPTCTATGSQTYICKCGASYNETIPKVSHNMLLSYTQERTVEHGGYELWECSKCGYQEKRNKTSAYPDASYADMCTMIDYRFLPAQDAPNRDVLLQLYQLREEEYATKQFHTAAICIPDINSDVKEWLLDNTPAYITFGLMYYVDRDNPVSLLVHPYDLDQTQKYLEWADEAHQCYALEDEIIRRLGIDTHTTQRQAIELINDWMCQNLYYDYDTRNSSALLMLQGEGGVCGAYATVFNDLCAACGINVIREVGWKENASGHAWNKVTFSDGSVYYVDTCWNDVQYVVRGVVVDTCVENGISQSKVRELRSKYLLQTYEEFAPQHHDTYSYQLD